MYGLFRLFRLELEGIGETSSVVGGDVPPFGLRVEYYYRLRPFELCRDDAGDALSGTGGSDYEHMCVAFLEYEVSGTVHDRVHSRRPVDLLRLVACLVLEIAAAGRLLLPFRISGVICLTQDDARLAQHTHLFQLLFGRPFRGSMQGGLLVGECTQDAGYKILERQPHHRPDHERCKHTVWSGHVRFLEVLRNSKPRYHASYCKEGYLRRHKCSDLQRPQRHEAYVFDGSAHDPAKPQKYRHYSYEGRQYGKYYSKERIQSILPSSGV